MEAWFDSCWQQRRPTVLVVGDIMCDTYLWGKVSRISPEAPVPIFASTERRQVLGGAANVAANLRALGCDVRLLGVIGADATGRCIREQLYEQGIADTWLVQDVTRPTTEKTRLIASQQQLLRLDYESQNPLALSLVSQALRSAEPLMRDIDGVVCSDYQKGVCTHALLEPLFTMARTAGHPIFVDPKAQDFSHYRGATVLKPNLQEVERASGMMVSDELVLTAAAEKLLQQSQAQALLVTRGKDGMTLFQPPQASVHIPTRAREVFDVTGAGDTVIATFSMAVLCGLSFVDAAHLANVAAGIVVGKLGTATILPEELRAALHAGDTFGERKVLQRGELAVALQYRRQRGERIVFTNGCFDLLHVGHIQYLQQARAMGECLVVALNDDASVRLLKGDKRPLLPQDERARLLAALACVDYVTLFGEATPLTLIELLRPDILVKGGDYTLDTVVGRKEVEAYGGEVRLVPYVPGVSTTGIIDSVMARYSGDAGRIATRKSSS
jgi:D-beta-D-heptose 7-phosphate kinase/D-beta-D-heptose 1-phosphate adenosyltransferase